MELVVIVQARIGGTRFPGKVLAPLLGQPLLLWQLARLSHVMTPHRLIVAIPPGEENRALAAVCIRHGYEVMAPEIAEEDVLGRFLAVARACHATEVVRICGDCPLIDPELVDQMIAYHRWHGTDMALTAIAAEWPDGQDVEVMTRQALEDVDRLVTAPHEREHVTGGIWGCPEKFQCQTFPCPLDLSRVQWSVDERGHLDLLERLLRPTLHRVGPRFTWRDLYTTMQLNPVVWEAILHRPARNSAYVQQVIAAGVAAPDATWQTLRYGQRNRPLREGDTSNATA